MPCQNLQDSNLKTHGTLRDKRSILLGNLVTVASLWLSRPVVRPTCPTISSLGVELATGEALAAMHPNNKAASRKAMGGPSVNDAGSSPMPQVVRPVTSARRARCPVLTWQIIEAVQEYRQPWQATATAA